MKEIIQRLRELEKNATKGPWKPITDWHEGDGSYTLCSWFGRGPQQCETKRHINYGKAQEEQAGNDAELIAETRNALPQLLDYIEKLEAENKKLKTVAKAARESMVVAQVIQIFGSRPIPADIYSDWFNSIKQLDEVITEVKDILEDDKALKEEE